jgi:hypothetical protein
MQAANTHQPTTIFSRMAGVVREWLDPSAGYVGAAGQPWVCSPASQRRVRRHLGLSARQWRKRQQQERRGWIVTSAKQRRLNNATAGRLVIYTNATVARLLRPGVRIRKLTPVFAVGGRLSSYVLGWDIGRGESWTHERATSMQVSKPPKRQA